MNTQTLRTSLLVGCLTGLVWFPIASFAADDWTAKVSESVLEQAESGTASFFVFVAEQAKLDAIPARATKLEKGRRVFEALTEVANRTQGSVIDVLRERQLTYRPYWIANMILVQGGMTDLAVLAARPDVSRILDNSVGRIPDLEPGTASNSESDYRLTVGWNLDEMRVPLVWDEGVRGQGATIGVIDTGQEWQHPALIDQYRGWDGAIADHNYNWHDAIHSGSVACGPDAQEPCDWLGHGTFVTGAGVGDDGVGNQIGVAPEAEWVGCRIAFHIGVPLDLLLECMEWMLAPTDLAGQNPDPSMAPDIVNASWVCLPEEGCVDPLALFPAADALHAAGIAFVSVATNDGPTCGSANHPPLSYPDVVAVGASNPGRTVASFSGRGPAFFDGDQIIKPDVIAPGVGITSSDLGGGYATSSATSWAAPQVAGTMALLISAEPSLAGDSDMLGQIIRSSATPVTSLQECGGIPGDLVPNNIAGWGFVDAYAAYLLATGSVSVSEDAPSVAVEVMRVSPNPLAPETSMGYVLHTPADVILEIYDASGRKVRDLVNAEGQQPGEHFVSWDGLDNGRNRVASGVYYYRLRASGSELAGSLVVTR